MTRWLAAVALAAGLAHAQANPEEEFAIDKDFDAMRPTTIAVMPMDNMSLEPGVEEALYSAVYARLATKGYSKISVDHVTSVMKRLGVTIPGLLAGFTSKRLGEELHADALLFGQVEQSARINKVAFDAVVVSCSLRLVDAKTATIIWHAEQWRTAHRQWQLDPLNALINAMAHSNSSRDERLNYLAQEMLKTLPQGPIEMGGDKLFDKATVVK
jgi:hypothetical protein